MCLAYLALRHSFTRGQIVKDSRERGSSRWNTWHSTQLSKRETDRVLRAAAEVAEQGCPWRMRVLPQNQGCRCRTRGAVTAEPSVPAWEPGVSLEKQGCHWRSRGVTGEPWMPLQNRGASAEWGCFCIMGLVLQNKKCCYRMGVPLQNRGACGRFDSNIPLDLGFKSVWSDL